MCKICIFILVYAHDLTSCEGPKEGIRPFKLEKHVCGMLKMCVGNRTQISCFTYFFNIAIRKLDDQGSL